MLRNRNIARAYSLALVEECSHGAFGESEVRQYLDAEEFARQLLLQVIEVMSATAVKAELNYTYMGDDVPTSVHQMVITKHFELVL